jgi:hypothetical protein
MKKTPIKNLLRDQVIQLSVDLFEFIEMNYGISPANDKFTEYFVNNIQKYYKHLTFENLESAFDMNASGMLDLYLPKIGQRPDNKVLKFNIPDLSKIINAYCRYTGIEKSEKGQEKKVFSNKEKKEIRHEWCNQLCEYFDIYKKDNFKSTIRTPLYTSKVLAKLGVLDYDRIDFDEPSTNIMQSSPRGNNEALIYESFDSLINKGVHINDFMTEFRNEFNGMPF